MTAYHGLLEPGSHRSSGLADDSSLVRAMLTVEAAWLRALAAVGAVDEADAEELAKVIASWRPDVSQLGRETEAAGNPVVPLVRALRAAVDDERLARLVHRGLTSQDVLDTALALLARDGLERVRDDLRSTAGTLAGLAERHRDSLMVGRTLTQYAVPITFGLKAAQWLTGVLDALDRVEEVASALPVQCGGAAGTLALAHEATGDAVSTATAFADELGLRWPGVPWHTSRAPITRLGDALAGVCDATGVVAADVALMGRPEIAEVSEGVAPGRGRSSTMPHKRNPVLSVLLRSAALQAPLLAAQLHLAAGQAVDERPDGAWHSEWPALRRLLELAVTVSSQAAELVGGLEIDTATMAARVASTAGDLLAERGGTGRPQDYLGVASQIVDAALTRATDLGLTHG